MNIGDKVVCIDDGPLCCNCNFGERSPLKRNQVYSIEGFTVDVNGILGLILLGVPIMHKDTTHSKGYNVRRFRKLDEMKMQSELEHLKKNLAVI